MAVPASKARGNTGRMAPAPTRQKPRIGVVWALFCLTLAVGAAAALGWFAPELVGMLPLGPDAMITAQGYAETVSGWAPPVMVGVGVLLVLTGAAAVVSGRRQGQRERVAVAVGGVTRSIVSAANPRASAADGAVRIRRSMLGRPRAVDVVLPAHFASEGHTARQDLEQAVARVLGGHWRGDWKDKRMRRGRVTLRTAEPHTESENITRDDKARLNLIARKIFGAEAAVKDSKSDPAGRITAFRLTFPPHPNLANPLFRERVAASLTEPLPGLWEVDWDLEADTVRAERRPHLDRTIPYLPVPVTAENKFRLPVAAVAGRLEAASWNLEGPTPHGLVVGETGGGKTYAFLVLAVELLRRGIPVFGVDPKMVELMSLEGWPGFESLATDPADMAEVIDYLEQLMMYRYRLIRQRKLRRADLWPVVLFLDELLILQDVLNDHWAEHKATTGTKGPAAHPALRKIVRLAALARTARIHVITGVQRPQATLFPEGARDNFRFRLSLGRLTQEGALQMWGDPHTGTTVPTGVPGRGTISTPTGPREAQVFKMPELDLTVPDHQLSPADAELRARLLAECRTALTERRPADPRLHIGGRPLPGAVTVTPIPPVVDPDPPVDPASLALAVDATPRPARTDPPAPEKPVPAAADELVLLPASALAIGDHFLLIEDGEDPTTVSDTAPEAVVEELTDGDDDLLLIDYRTIDGVAGQLEVDPNEELPMAPLPPD